MFVLFFILYPYLQVRNRVLKPFEAAGAVPKQALAREAVAQLPAQRQPRVLEKLEEIDTENMTLKKIIESQKLIIQYLKSQVKQKLPDKVKEVLEALKKCNLEINEEETIEAVAVTTKTTRDFETQVNIEVKKPTAIACVGTEHNTRKEIPTQTEPKNCEVTDRALSSCFKCRSFNGVPLKIFKQISQVNLKGKFLKNTGVNMSHDHKSNLCIGQVIT